MFLNSRFNFLVMLLVFFLVSSVKTSEGTGTWKFTSDNEKGGAFIKAVCKDSGRGEYFLPGRNPYPSRCSYSNSILTIKVWAYEEHVGIENPAIFMEFYVDGDKISGVSKFQNNERYSGYRLGTSGKSRAEIAEEKSRITARENEKKFENQKVNENVSQSLNSTSNPLHRKTNSSSNGFKYINISIPYVENPHSYSNESVAKSMLKTIVTNRLNDKCWEMHKGYIEESTISYTPWTQGHSDHLGEQRKHKLAAKGLSGSCRHR